MKESERERERERKRERERERERKGGMEIEVKSSHTKDTRSVYMSIETEKQCE